MTIYTGKSTIIRTSFFCHKNTSFNQFYPTPEQEASPYKADLREVFPFCIPFDLIHLFKVFDAEPEAPVFKFPLDLELDNPWTGEKVVDYHHEFEFDFSDYEDLIKLLRIIQIVAFITGLMMITRQQMIKG